MIPELMEAIKVIVMIITSRGLRLNSFSQLCPICVSTKKHTVPKILKKLRNSLSFMSSSSSAGIIPLNLNVVILVGNGGRPELLNPGGVFEYVPLHVPRHRGSLDELQMGSNEEGYLGASEQSRNTSVVAKVMFDFTAKVVFATIDSMPILYPNQPSNTFPVIDHRALD
eukprot:CAMPEP_0114530786 /NCGR_PEP_ID=MMETSP0109-20121206/25656_1 /TAXON_ID=29199 /ORGANISM="Chlorarachnion reptans, Strain CCCM449" /LENGTH=168 /DNA_ID=CAMNT_0001713483 /DNA_START=255 /DNA_END=761 /DNA_ORIENTATION=+